MVDGMDDVRRGGQGSGDPRDSGLTMLTDLYQLTMAQGYWRAGMEDTQASFTMFIRSNPFDGGYTIACGIDQLADLVEHFAFTDDDLAYLSGVPAPGGGMLFSPDFLDHLSTLRLTLDIDTVPEGSLVFPREPIVRVNGSILQCQLIETALLNGINFQSLIATKAARVCQAAQGPVAAFGLRRAQGPDGGLSSDRAAYVGGCSSVANVLAGKRYGIPVSGTHAHSWVMAFPSELEAFRRYAREFPTNCVLLVDTFDVMQGVRNAITVGLEMRERGDRLSGIRIDSGDLAWLSKRARAMLDEAGLGDTTIVASNSLDEYTITSLKEQGACIDAWGVGTRLATAYDQPALGGVYKLSAIRRGDGPWEPRLKISEQAVKLTIPGVQGLRRYYHEDGTLAGDMIYDVNEGPRQGDEVIVHPLDPTQRKDLSDRRFKELLVPLARHGAVLGREDIATVRARAASQLALLDVSIRRFSNPHPYPAGIERGLYGVRTALVLALRGFDPASATVDAHTLERVRAALACAPGSLAGGGGAVVPRMPLRGGSDDRC